MEFRRFVSYIYSYNQNEKEKNHGFAKIEIRQDVVKFIIHMDLPIRNPMKYQVYGFIRKEQIPEGILLFDGMSTGNVLDMRFQLPTENLMESGWSMEELSGLIIVENTQKYYASVWDEDELQLDKFKVKADEDTKEENIIENDIQAQEIVMQPMQPVSGDGSMFQWNHLEERCPYMIAIEELPQVNFLRMQPKHLKYFPRTMWHLGRNSFLLHGYYNYRYLILGKDEKHILLGIPGVYHPSEEKVAALFGFGKFCPAKKCKNLRGAFGYWCKEISAD